MHNHNEQNVVQSPRWFASVSMFLGSYWTRIIKYIFVVNKNSLIVYAYIDVTLIQEMYVACR